MIQDGINVSMCVYIYPTAANVATYAVIFTLALHEKETGFFSQEVY
jgi:hypothetical protein